MKLSILLILFIFCNTVPAFSVTNIYRLEYGTHTRPWQESGIMITARNSNTVQGYVVLDFSIGPEGRAPMDFEKRHVLPFQARVSGLDGMLTFRVAIKGHIIMNFYLYESSWQGSPALSGYATIENPRVKGSLPVTAGVIAIESRNTEQE